MSLISKKEILVSGEALFLADDETYADLKEALERKNPLLCSMTNGKAFFLIVQEVVVVERRKKRTDVSP